MEALFGIIGLAMFYSWIHFSVITFKKVYKKRTQYEKILTWFAIASLFLYIIGTL